MNRDDTAGTASFGYLSAPITHAFAAEVTVESGEPTKCTVCHRTRRKHETRPR